MAYGLPTPPRQALWLSRYFVQPGLLQVAHIAPAYQGQAAVWRPQQAVDAGVAQLPGAGGLQVLVGGKAV